jgi:predicted PurR-regulated permease PerM
MPDSLIPEGPRSTPSSPSQRRALGIFALAAVVALLALAAPVSSGLLLGTLLAFSLLGTYERFSARSKRPVLAAVLLAVGSGLAILGGLFGIVYFVVVRGTAAAQRLSEGLKPEGTLQKLTQRVEDLTRALPFGPIDLTGRIRAGASEAATQLAKWLGSVAEATLSGVLTLFFTVMTTFFVLRHWTELLRRSERMLPLHPKHTRVVMSEFQIVGKEVFVGTMLTGLAQGLLAGIGYAIAGVAEPALLATITAICSLVPAVGTMLVWVPLGIGLIAAGHPVGGIFLLLWGAFVVVGLSDYVIRPSLVGGHGHVPTLLTFISLFGGVEVFGLLGLIVGPVIASVALALLRTYDREICET